VEVALDGEAWRTLPAEVVLRSGLGVGVELDRERARRVGRELRRHQALARATNVLRRRDVSVKELDARLERAHVDPTTRAEVVTRLDEVGLIDDERFASGRAQVLAERGAGNELIRHDLSGRGIGGEVIEAAVGLLEPESTRAARVVERRGSSAKTGRYLAGKGFSGDAIESALDAPIAEDAPPAVF
jgi:regulatory protein